MPKLLLVEDIEDNRVMLVRRLRSRGFEVVVAVDGEDGCARALTELPDLILMDIGLPGISGYEATRRLKAMPETQAIPIVALTARAMPDDLAHAREAGCDDCDTKPVDLPRLLDKIGKLLEGKGPS
jgi:CheY-like chemotaxis protein